MPLISCSEGGFFKAHLLFPKEYPQKPPKMKFVSEMWHPNGKRMAIIVLSKDNNVSSKRTHTHTHTRTHSRTHTCSNFKTNTLVLKHTHARTHTLMIHKHSHTHTHTHTYDINDLTVDKNGDVCISILHDPGEDKWGYERPEERWLPIHTVETIIMSVISMLADPNDESPANVDAGVS